MSSVQERIKPVGQDDKFLRFLIHGDPGTGKTPLAGSSENCLILNADPAGTQSAAIAKSTAKRIDLEDWRGFEDVYEYLRHEKHGFKWVWLDSVTGWQDLGLNDIMENLVAAKPHRQIWLPDRGEYRENMTRLRLMIRHLAGLPINFGITAQSMMAELPDGEQLLVPAIQGIGMWAKISGYMGMIGHMRIGTVEGKQVQILDVRPSKKWLARDRYNTTTTGKWINPSIPVIQAAATKNIVSGSSSRATNGAAPKKSIAAKKG